MATTAERLIERANLILQDVSNTRWSQAELLGWLNEAQLMIINLQPSAYAEYRTVELVAGTKQSLSDDNIRLLDIIRNQDGIYDAAIRVVSRLDLDTQVPFWHKHNPNHIVQHYMYDMAEPDTFYVYPPVPEKRFDEYGTPIPRSFSTVEILQAVVPPDMENVKDKITLKDIYVPALVDYMVYRAYSKDSEASANQNLKQMYYEQFLAALGRQGTANKSTAA